MSRNPIAGSLRHYKPKVEADKRKKKPPKVCECFAREPNECVCGSWDDVDSAWWYDDEA